MTKKIFRFLYDREKEERWLNEMADAGWLLSHFFMGLYTFAAGEAGAYTYRTIMLEELYNTPKSQAYLRFLQETGVEPVDCYMRWAFLRKLKSEGPLEVYTSVESRLIHHKRMRNFWLTFTILEAICFCMTLPAFVLSLRTDLTFFPYLVFPPLLLFFALAMMRQLLKEHRHVNQLKQEGQLHE